MPKIKSKSAVKKRFIVTGNGSVKAKPAHKRHRLISKPKSMKNKARGMFLLDDSNATTLLTHYMPYERSKKRGKKSPSPAESKAIKAAKAEATAKASSAAPKAPKKVAVKKAPATKAATNKPAKKKEA